MLTSTCICYILRQNYFEANLPIDINLQGSSNCMGLHFKVQVSGRFDEAYRDPMAVTFGADKGVALAALAIYIHY